jgi:hypothetical protein
MSPFQRLTCVTSVLLLATVLCGIHRRRLYRIARWLAPYLAVVMLGELLVLLWTDRFYVWEFWLAKETLYGALKLALAVELGGLIFTAFPGAAATARRASLLVLGGICVTLLAAPSTGVKLQDLALELQPRLANGTAFLLLVVWLLALWYHVPTHPFHRAILAGLSSYLLVFTVLLRFLDSRGWEVQYLTNYADALGYLVMLGYWNWVVWRREPAEEPRAELLRALQPWRGTL